MSESQIEPLMIVKTSIEYISYSETYDLEVKDQYGRWWIYSKAYGISMYEAEELEVDELRKGIIDLDLYRFDNNRIIKRIKRKEKVLYVYTFNMGNECGDNCIDPDIGGYVRAITKDGLEYGHDKVFYDYEKLKEFALKIKEKGIINLEFWRCFGSYEWEGDAHLELEEGSQYFEEESHEWDSIDIYNLLGGEDGERKYMSDGAWMNPDGTIDFER